MAQSNIRKLIRTFQPAAVATPETKVLFNIKKGERVLWASAQVIRAAAAGTDSTISLGDGDSAVGFIAATDTEATTAGTIVAAAGAYTNQSGGKLYLADDTVDADYAHGGTPGAVAPIYRFTIAVTKDWPA
jgi:hypothetical protein